MENIFRLLQKYGIFTTFASFQVTDIGQKRTKTTRYGQWLWRMSYLCSIIKKTTCRQLQKDMQTGSAQRPHDFPNSTARVEGIDRTCYRERFRH